MRPLHHSHRARAGRRKRRDRRRHQRRARAFMQVHKAQLKPVSGTGLVRTDRPIRPEHIPLVIPGGADQLTDRERFVGALARGAGGIRALHEHAGRGVRVCDRYTLVVTWQGVVRAVSGDLAFYVLGGGWEQYGLVVPEAACTAQLTYE